MNPGQPGPGPSTAAAEQQRRIQALAMMQAMAQGQQQSQSQSQSQSQAPNAQLMQFLQSQQAQSQAVSPMQQQQQQRPIQTQGSLPPALQAQLAHVKTLPPEQQADFFRRLQQARGQQQQQQQQQQANPDMMRQLEALQQGKARQLSTGSASASASSIPLPNVAPSPAAGSPPTFDALQKMREAQRVAQSPRPPSTPVDGPPPQQAQFIQHLSIFMTKRNTPLPSSITSGDTAGTLPIGDRRVDLWRVWGTIMSAGGFQKMSSMNGWPRLAQYLGLPDRLGAEFVLPGSEKKSESSAEHLMAAYLAWLAPFEAAWNNNKAKQAQEGQQQQTPGQQQQTLGQGQPSQPPVQPQPQVINPLQQFQQQQQQRMASPQQSPTMQTLPSPSQQRQPSQEVKQEPQSKPLPPPIITQLPRAPTPVAQTPTVATPKAPTPAAIAPTPEPPTPASDKKRKRKQDGSATPASTPKTIPEPEPALPRRQRFKVEYKPLAITPRTTAGWDLENVVQQTNALKADRVPRRNDELGAVDLESVAMSMASRLPHEVSYALAVLAMLSVPEPGETQHGLDLHHYPDLLLELLDLIADSVFGDGGYSAWREAYDAQGIETDPNALTHSELVAEGTDVAWWRESQATSSSASPRETAVAIAGINLLRNYSMAEDNQSFFSRTPQLLILLADITDARLCRREGVTAKQPFTHAELCRVRKDVLQILANLGFNLDLRTVPLETTQSLLQLIHSVVADALEQSLAIRPLYGPQPRPEDAVPLNLDHALNAFSHFALTDTNREVLLKLAPEHLISLFSAFIKLLPLTRYDFAMLQSSDNRLAHVECLALCLFHLAFLAPLAVRTEMRRIPGVLAILTRIIFDCAPRGPDFVQNPFNVLCRRLTETIGCLNQASAAEAPSMSFSAGAGDGWKPGKAKHMEPGLLAPFEAEVVRTLIVDKMDPVAFNELEALLWQSVDN